MLSFKQSVDIKTVKVVVSYLKGCNKKGWGLSTFLFFLEFLACIIPFPEYLKLEHGTFFSNKCVYISLQLQ